jgi:hypothetical protein
MRNSVRPVQSIPSPLAQRQSLDLAIPSPAFTGVERGNLGGSWRVGFTLRKKSGHIGWNG